MQKPQIVFWPTLLCFLVGAQISRADIVYFQGLGTTNGVPDVGSFFFNTNEFQSIGASFAAPAPVQIAAPFTPGGNFDLTEIDLALANVQGTNSAMVSLVKDSGGLPTGTTIESWTETGLPGPSPSSQASTLFPTSPVGLMAGQQYWILASVIASDTLDGWAGGNFAGFNTTWAFDAGQGWFVRSDFVLEYDVLGNPISTPAPEPSCLSLLGTVLGAFACKRLTRLRARAS